MKKKIVFLLALSVLLVTAITMNSTLAYFTTYVEAKGGKILDLSGGPNMEEDFGQWTKRVVITNDGQPVFVRVKAFAGSDIKLEYDGSGWGKNPYDANDDYYYYQGEKPDEPRYAIVQQDSETTELLIQITLPEKYVEAAEGDSFNVIVIYETTPVRYDDDGNPYADWSALLEGGEVW